VLVLVGVSSHYMCRMAMRHDVGGAFQCFKNPAAGQAHAKHEQEE
jgi:hypothetical protein